jgi:hypothetical protein
MEDKKDSLNKFEIKSFLGDLQMPGEEIQNIFSFFKSIY